MINWITRWMDRQLCLHVWSERINWEAVIPPGWGEREFQCIKCGKWLRSTFLPISYVERPNS